jgi:hypothetical protein
MCTYILCVERHLGDSDGRDLKSDECFQRPLGDLKLMDKCIIFLLHDPYRSYDSSVAWSYVANVVTVVSRSGLACHLLQPVPSLTLTL